MKVRLAAAAEANSRSMTQEIVLRLEASLAEDQHSAAAGMENVPAEMRKTHKVIAAYERLITEAPAATIFAAARNSEAGARDFIQKTVQDSIERQKLYLRLTPAETAGMSDQLLKMSFALLSEKPHFLDEKLLSKTIAEILKKAEDLIDGENASLLEQDFTKMSEVDPSLTFRQCRMLAIYHSAKGMTEQFCSQLLASTTPRQ